MKRLCILYLLLQLPYLVSCAPIPQQQCPNYNQYSRQRHDGNRSAGKYALPLQRPSEECRSYYSWEVEHTIARLRTKIKDPDLFRLFENAFPNTLDTMVKWKGFKEENGTQTDEDLAFVITGDINAMWLRDSANQILSYSPVLTASTDPQSLAALFRGTINAHSRYIKFSPYCHAYQPFPESGIPLENNGAYRLNTVNPRYDRTKTFDCKWELDSLASFLQLSAAYFEMTKDIGPFAKYTWLETIQIILDAVDKMRIGTYSAEGRLMQPGYTMFGQTNRGTETTTNNGHGNPVTGTTGMIRSTFRPSDDATIFQFLVPSNMMFAAMLERTVPIVQQLASTNTINTSHLAHRMTQMALEIHTGIKTHAIVQHPSYGAIFAFEVDGYGSRNLMDDANLPSLLSAPLMGYSSKYDEVYLNTRLFALSSSNPYWCKGPVLNAIGGPHVGIGKGWPLSNIVRVMTSADASGEETRGEIRNVLASTDGLGLVHESVSAHNEREWSRHWFGWANGMFGEMIMYVEREYPWLLEENYQW